MEATKERRVQDMRKELKRRKKMGVEGRKMKWLAVEEEGK